MHDPGAEARSARETAGAPPAASALRAAFAVFDPSRRGTVRVSEVEACLQRVQAEGAAAAGGAAVPLLLSELADVRRQKSELTFAEFEALFGPTDIAAASYEAVARSLFPLFDRDGTGFISAEGLRRACEEVGERVSEAELAEMIRRADKDGDGFVNVDDFYALMTRKPL